MKNIFNFFNRKADYTAKKNDLANDAISFVVDEHKIYVKDQWFGGSGDGSGSGSGESTVIENPYDDTEVRGLISNVNSRLDNLVLLTQQDVQNTVTSMIADMRSFIDNFGWDAMFNDSGWNEEMRAYIQTVGFTDSENNQVSWSQFYQDFKTLQSVVSQINIGGTDEDINYETIQAMINSTIDGNTAINEIKSKWALAAENEKVLKWLASGFAAQANQGGSFAQVYAAGQNANTTAISALETRVDDIEDDVDSNTTAIASLSTRVDNAISGLVTQAALNNATSAIYSQLDGVTAAVATAVKKDENGRVTSSITFGADNVALNENGSGYLAGGNINWDTAGNVNMKGKINATSGTIGGWTIEENRLSSTEYDEANDMTYNGRFDPYGLDISTTRKDDTGSTLELFPEYITFYNYHDSVVNGYHIHPERGFYAFYKDDVVDRAQIGESIFDGIEYWTYFYAGKGSVEIGNEIKAAIFNRDGSGSLANGNLSWDENGNIRIGDDLDDENLHSYKGVSLTKDLFKIGYQEESVDAGLTFDTSTNSLSISEDEGHHSYKGINISPSGLVLNATSAAILLSLVPQTSRDLARQASNINITTDQIPNYVHTLINKSGIYTQLPIKTTESVQAPSVQVESKLIIGDGAVVSVPTPAGNGLYTPNEGYTGTINGARFVKGICVGAA